MRYIKANRHGGHQGRINRVVMHSTVSPCGPGWALRIAKMFATTSRAASAHYVVDCDRTIRCLPDHTVGYHAPPNTGSIGIEQCDWSRGPRSRWLHGNHLKMLQRSAALTARLCKKYDIPVRHVGPAELRAGKRGICGHIDVTRAWHQTTHTDPDSFPWGPFLDMVRAGGGAIEEDDMDRASLSLGKPIRLNPHRTTVGFDEKHGDVPGWDPGEPSILHGPCRIYQAGYVGKVTGLLPGQAVDVEIVEAVKHGKDWDIGRPVGLTSVRADEDGTAVFDVASLPGGYLPKGGRVWLRVHCHGATDATLTYCNGQAWWTE
ncbi:MAG: N-acetylmuramoyl-L-alanine amidase [Nocardioidaceae bacterium]